MTTFPIVKSRYGKRKDWPNMPLKIKLSRVKCGTMTWPTWPLGKRSRWAMGFKTWRFCSPQRTLHSGLAHRIAGRKRHWFTRIYSLTSASDSQAWARPLKSAAMVANAGPPNSAQANRLGWKVLKRPQARYISSCPCGIRSLDTQSNQCG